MFSFPGLARSDSPPPEIGNVVEAISMIPASATWFPKTELADWPCVVMSGLKFEQMDAENQNEKVDILTL